MPVHSEISLGQIQQLYNRVNDLLRKNMLALRTSASAAAQATNTQVRQRHLDELAALKRSRVVIVHQHAAVSELEFAYEMSNRGESQAEIDLKAGVQSANALVKSINNIADTLNKVSEFAGIITRLIGIFK